MHYKNFDIENFRRPKCFPTFLIDKIFFNFRVFSYDLEISKCCQNTRLARTESRLARPKPGWPARVTSLALSFPARFYSSDWTICNYIGKSYKITNIVGEYLSSHASKIIKYDYWTVSINLGAKFVYFSNPIDLATQISVLFYSESLKIVFGFFLK